MAVKLEKIWTVVWKEEGEENVKTYSYTDEESALQAKKMVEEGNGEWLYDESENPVSILKIEFVQVIETKLRRIVK